MKYDPISFGKRLSEEVERKRLSLRDLEVAVEAQLRKVGANTRGASRGNLSTWIRGMGPEGGEPRRNIVEALAIVLSGPRETIRPEYLLYGGPRTDKDFELLNRISGIIQEHKPTLFERLQAEIPELGQFELMVNFALTDFLLGASVFVEENGGRALAEDELIDLGRKTWGWATYPLSIVGQLANRNADAVYTPRGAASDSVVLAIQALRAAFRDVSIPPQQGETNA